jgi:NADP-dependent 3-hydroxy acid dehydrogenase YdfG
VSLLPRRGVDLPGAVVVLTGASSGIGRAAAVRFAQAGTDVVLAARSREPLEQVAAECRAAGARTLVVPTDVADPDAVEALAARAVDGLGRLTSGSTTRR